MIEETTSAVKTLDQIDRLWNEGEISLVDEMFAPDFVRHDPYAGVIAGPQQMGEYIRALRIQYPDIEVSIEEHLFDDDRMVIQWRFEGTDVGRPPRRETTPTGQPVDINGVDILHFRNGKAVDNYVYYDLLNFNQQLGRIPQALF